MKEGEQRQGPRAPWARARSPSEATPTYLGVALAHAPDDAPDHHDAAHGVEGAVDLGPVVAHEERAEGQQEEPQHDEADAEGLLISHGCLGGRGTRADARTHPHREGGRSGTTGDWASGGREGGSLRVQLQSGAHGSSRLQELRFDGPGTPPHLDSLSPSLWARPEPVCVCAVNLGEGEHEGGSRGGFRGWAPAKALTSPHLPAWG